MEQNTQKDRYYLIDAIRGMDIISMIAYHFLYDVNIVYGRNPNWYWQLPVHLWQQSICWIFIFISGFVWQWGKKANLRRGLWINGCGILVTAVTLLAAPEEAIWFGVLTFIGCAVLFLIPLDRYLQKVNPVLGISLSLFLFALFKNVQEGSLALGKLELLRLPSRLYTIKILTPLGFPFPDFVSSDYFPFFPWIFLYLAGYFSCFIFMKKEVWKKAAQKKVPLFTVIGQKSIFIYLLHQPICMLICMLLFG